MEVYAEHLTAELDRLNDSSIILEEYRPALGSLSHLPEVANLRMRIARYISYPLQARRRGSHLNHILDHGYAHLMSVLDSVRTVVTVHDIIPILAGRGVIPGIRREGRSWLAEFSSRYLRKAAHLIAISENTRRDLIDHCDCDPDRISVIYYGVTEAFRPLGARSEARFRLGLTQEVQSCSLQDSSSTRTTRPPFESSRAFGRTFPGSG